MHSNQSDRNPDDGIDPPKSTFSNRRSWRSATLGGATAAVAVALILQSPGIALAQSAPERDPVELILAARRRANERAEAVFSLESELDGLEEQEAKLVEQVTELTDRVEELELVAEAIAIDAFTGNSEPGIPVLTEGRDPLDKITEQVLADVVNGEIDVDVDAYDHAVVALDDAEADLKSTRDDVEKRRSDVAAALDEAFEEIEVLRQLESEYLIEDSAAAASQAAAAVGDRIDEEEQRDERLAYERSIIPGSKPNTAAGADGEAAPEPIDDGEQRAVDINGDIRGGRTSNGAVVAGRTGQGGTGNDGELPPPAPFVCPVAGASSYANTWGAPRSGGRTHQGVDMLAVTGTPLVAVVAGRTVQRTNNLGGVTTTLFGDDGHRYYYAHLDRYEGGSRQVAQGEVIGYVGDTGNATGIPHLHFEIHPGGGVAVNPYETVRAAGC